MEGNKNVLEIKNEDICSKNKAKELLNSLLKEVLDHKINKLEKKHIEESNSLKIMSKISQNIIIALDHYSHKLRKEIYKLRHKNDESKKKREHDSYRKNDLNKTMFKDDKINKNILDNNIDLLINKDNKYLLDCSNQSKQKRPSKSIDPKKDKSFFSEVSNNNKEKSGKKEKNDVFSRLASKSIGNFKKLKLGMNTPLTNRHIFNSKSKNKKLTSSTKNIHNILNKKHEGEKNNEHSPSNKDASNNKNDSKIISTPKMKQKRLKKIEQITIENGSNGLGTVFSKIKNKKANSKGKIGRKFSKTISGLKKEEENKIIDNNTNRILVQKKPKIEINPEIYDKVKDNESKIPEVKITNTILKKENYIDNINNIFPPKKDVKRSIKERLLMDEEMLKNVNKDELLVSEINDEEKLNEINEISAINLEDLNLKESININFINIENNAIIKKPSVEINSSVNSFNNNTLSNNIMIISSKNNCDNDINKKNNSNVNENHNNISEINNISKTSNNINNILISSSKNNPVNFLDNDNEINFTLVEDCHIDENDNDLNKTIDLNISGLSDQLSLQEKFEAHLDEISRYLDIKDICNLMLINKESFTTIMNILISKIEITIDILEEEINKLKESNKDIDFTNISIEPFKLSSNSSRAISLLNNSSDCNLIKFEKNNSINREIFIVFGIFFIAAGKKKEYLRLNNEEDKINYIYNYFKKDIEKMSLGSLIEKEINGKLFDDDIVSTLFKYSNKYISIISPSRFQKSNKDVAIFVFVVKNILEHIGILDQQNIKINKEYILYNARLKNNKMILEELNSFFDKIH